MPNILGLDVGERKIGVAIGATETGLAFPRPALLVNDWTEAWPLLDRLLKTEAIAGIVIGWPRNSDGRDGPQAARIGEFITELRTRTAIPIQKFDERLTTQAVNREQAAVDRKLTRGQEDSYAAQLILESYLQPRP